MRAQKGERDDERSGCGGENVIFHACKCAIACIKRQGVQDQLVFDGRGKMDVIQWFDLKSYLMMGKTEHWCNNALAGTRTEFDGFNVDIL